MRAHAFCAEPVGERVHVAVLDHGLLDDQRRAPARSPRAAGCSRCCAATLPAISSRPSTDRSMLATCAISSDQQDRDDQRRDEPDHQRDRPVGVPEVASERHLADRHLPQRPRGVQDPHARVVDPRRCRRARSVCSRTTSTASSAVRPAWRSASPAATIVITIAAATAITTTPSTMPIVQPVLDAIVSNASPQTNGGSGSPQFPRFPTLAGIRTLSQTETLGQAGRAPVSPAAGRGGAITLTSGELT